MGLAAFVALTSGPAAAAVEDGQVARVERYVPPVHILGREADQTLVRRVQKALTATGLYRGPVNGRWNDETEEAIQKYQRRNDIRVDGRVNGVASFDRAVTAATDISDTQLKAQILWTLVADRRRAGDTAGAVATQDLAETASVAIKSALSRVWMYGDLARDHLDAGERTEAFDAFKRSLHIAEAIENAWARARALSRVADTLIEITGADGTARP